MQAVLDSTVVSDEDLAIRARNNDCSAYEILINKYKNLVRAKTSTYFLVGADREDIVQEGMIGLFKAIRDYRPDKFTSFRGFADICITRQIITAIKTATRNKHVPLNNYVSFHLPVYEEDSNVTLEDIIAEKKTSNPEDLFIVKENYKDMEGRISGALSKFERDVLEGYLEGKTYVEIAEVLGKQVKAIDNALQRIKRKLECCSVV